MILPLWDENPFRKERLPYVTWGIIGLNAIVFLIEMAGSQPLELLFKTWGCTPAALFQGVSPTGISPFITIFTSMFLHEDWIHLLGNMLFLWIFGDDIEEALGRVRFAIFYLASGVAAAIAFAVTSPQSTVPLIGASGAIAAVLAAYLMFRPCKKVTTLVMWVVVKIDAFWFIGVWGLLQIVELTIAADDGVGYAAHLGGLMAGGALFWLMRPAGLELFQCFDDPAVASADSGSRD